MKVRYFFLLMIMFIVYACGPKVMVKETFEELNKAAEIDPNNPTAHYNLGVKYYSEEQYDKALVAFKEATVRDSHFSEAYFGIYCSEILRDKKLRKQMLKDEPDKDYKAKVDYLKGAFQKAFMYNPFFEWKLGTLLLTRRETASNVYLQEFYDLYYKIFYDGFEEFFLGNYEEADKKLTYSLSVKEDFEQARYVRALARVQKKEYEQAAYDLDSLIIANEKLNKDKILPVYQETAEYYFLIGSIYMLVENYDEAKENFEKALLEDMSLYMAHFQLSNIYLKKNNFKEALSEIESALLINPDDPLLLFNKGVFSVKLGKINQAIEAYKTDIENNKYSFKSCFNLALIYESLGNKGEAKKYYELFFKRARNSEHALIEKTRSKIAQWN